MADKYASFQELQRGERRGSHRVLSRARKATIAVIAPHGGKIEPGTSEIARKIAGADYSFYSFEGRRSGTINRYTSRARGLTSRFVSGSLEARTA